MDFSFTAEQQELRAAVRDIAGDRGSSAQRRAAVEGVEGYDADLWRLVSKELGLSAVAVPESHGGTGASYVEVAVVLEESARALLPVPLLPTLVAAAAVDDADVLAAAAGGAAASVAIGDPGEPVPHVLDGHLADWLVIAGPDGLYVAATADDGVRVDAAESLDPTRRQATVEVTSGALRQVGDAASSARAVDLLRVALAVESVGLMRWCLATTVDYLKTRVQFERPIGSFQALQHRAADLAVSVESSASTAYYAAWAAAQSPEELPVVAPLALSVCAEAAFQVAAETIQLHGGIGFTWEHDAHLYFKRATVNRLLLGDPAAQRRVVAERAGIAP